MMNEWEEEAWNTTAPPQYNFDQPEEPVRDIPSFEVNTRPGYRPAPPQQQQPVVGGPYSRMINSNWQNPDYGPAQGSQEVTQGWANIPAGAYQFGEGLVTDPIGTAKAVGQAVVDPQTYVEAGKSAVGMHGPEGMGEFWGSMAIPMPKIQRGALWNAIKDKPGTKRVREMLDGVGRSTYTKDGWANRPGKDYMKMASEYFKDDPTGTMLWQMQRSDPGRYAVHKAEKAFLETDGALGMFHPAARRVTVPKADGTPRNKHTRRHEDAHAIFHQTHRPDIRKAIQAELGTPSEVQFRPMWPHFSAPKNPKFLGHEYSWNRGPGSRFLDEATSNIVGEQSVTQGLRKWGESLSRKDTPYPDHMGRPAGYMTRALAETMNAGQKAWNAGEGALPRVVRTGIMMHDSPSREGIPAESTGIDRTKFYAP